jgi:hypothetical protein
MLDNKLGMLRIFRKQRVLRREPLHMICNSNPGSRTDYGGKLLT